MLPALDSSKAFLVLRSVHYHPPFGGPLPSTGLHNRLDTRKHFKLYYNTAQCIDLGSEFSDTKGRCSRMNLVRNIHMLTFV